MSQRLRDGTAQRHRQMHQLMGQADPFASRAAYGRYLHAQWQFLRSVEHMATTADLRVLVPDLDTRGRAEACRSDLDDLGLPVPSAAWAATPPDGERRMPHALGWLYVSEGSTLGAAFLLKEVEQRLGLDGHRGARHLAATAEGRAAPWKRFVAALDAAAFTPRGSSAVVEGACQAFDHFAALLRAQFPLPLSEAASSSA